VNDLTPVPFERLHAGPAGRNPDRFPVIRTAKLVFPDGEYPCVLRDISGSALRVKLYGSPPPPAHASFFLEFGDGDRFEVSLIWCHDGQAGLAFAEANNLLSVIGERGRFPKRAIRIAIDLPARIRSPGGMVDVVIRDLSHQGAQIECPQLLAVDQPLRLAIPALGDVYAKVRWRTHPLYGIAFVETFRFEKIAAMSADLHALSQAWRDGQPGGCGTAGLAA